MFVCVCLLIVGLARASGPPTPEGELHLPTVLFVIGTQTGGRSALDIQDTRLSAYRALYELLGFRVIHVPTGIMTTAEEGALLLYAQLRGEATNFGPELTERLGLKSSFGLDFSGQGRFPEWSKEHPVSIFAFSFGCAISMTLASLLETGLPETFKLDPTASTLFEGNRFGWISAIQCHAGVTSGVSVAHVPGFARALIPMYCTPLEFSVFSFFRVDNAQNSMLLEQRGIFIDFEADDDAQERCQRTLEKLIADPSSKNSPLQAYTVAGSIERLMRFDNPSIQTITGYVRLSATIALPFDSGMTMEPRLAFQTSRMTYIRTLIIGTFSVVVYVMAESDAGDLQPFHIGSLWQDNDSLTNTIGHACPSTFIPSITAPCTNASSLVSFLEDEHSVAPGSFLTLGSIRRELHETVLAGQSSPYFFTSLGDLARTQLVKKV